MSCEMGICVSWLDSIASDPGFVMRPQLSFSPARKAANLEGYLEGWLCKALNRDTRALHLVIDHVDIL
jgi:hypothetical protein